MCSLFVSQFKSLLNCRKMGLDKQIKINFDPTTFLNGENVGCVLASSRSVYCETGQVPDSEANREKKYCEKIVNEDENRSDK